MNWRGRLRELLSDVEADVLRFTTALGEPIVDVREQFRLSLDSAPHELAAYDVRTSDRLFKGTLELSKQMGIKHPMTHGNGDSAPWIMTTDLLITLKKADGTYALLALADKTKETLKPRAISLLSLERAYWEERGVEWLLITPNLYDDRVAMTMRRVAAWALGDPVSNHDLQMSIMVAKSTIGHSLTHVLNEIASFVGRENDRHQRSLWQAVWYGHLPVDLRRSWRPHAPLELISPAEFEAQNPVICRRTAWI